MKLRSLDKAAELPQTKATWQSTLRLAPAWIAPKGKPKYRPYLLFVVEAESGLIRLLTMEDQRPAPEAVFSLLVNAMAKPAPGAGGRNRPARIMLDDRELVEALTPRLTEIGVRCDYAASMPAVDTLLRELTAHLNDMDERPGLMAAPGVTQPLVAEFYAAALYFYEQEPWRWVDNLAAIEVRYPASDPTRYAVIMGFGGQEFGLAIYLTAKDLKLQYTALDPDQLMRKMTAMSVTYSEPDLLAFDDLDAIAKHGWPIAGPNAYPLTMKSVPPGELSPFSSAEIALFAAALRTLPDFVTQHLRGEGATLRAAEAIYPLPNVHANQQIAYRYPTDVPELAALRDNAAANDEEIERMIEQWFWDEPSHAFARQVGAFLLDFLSDLAMTGVSRQTLRKHEQNCWLIGKFTCDYSGSNAFTPAIFQGGPRYLNEFRRKVSSSAAALTSYQATWRKLDRYVRALDRI